MTVSELLDRARTLVKDLDHETIVAVQICAELQISVNAPVGSSLAELLDERGLLNELGYAVAALL